jgi:hypothetical protein
MKLQTNSGKILFDTGKIGERFRRAWSGLRLKEVNEYSTATSGNGYMIDPDENDYRRVTQSKRDLPPIKQERAIELSYAFAEKDPLAQRLLRVPLEAIASAGLEFKAEDDRIYELWNEWWECPLYPLWGFKARYYSITTQSLWIDARIAGEAIWPFVVSPFAGKLELAYIDPSNVEQIKTQPGNALVKDQIILKRGLGLNDEQRVLQIVRPYPDYKSFFGNTFYFSLNAPVNSSRGRPQLLALLDWIDLYDQSMFNDAELQSMRSRILYDIEVQNADEPKLRKMEQQYFPGGQAPKPGTAFFHNSEMKMEIKVPDLKNGDFVAGVQNQRRHIIGGNGMNEVMLGLSGDMNAVAARESSIPVVWKIESEQRFDQMVISTVFSCVISKAIEARRQLESGIMDESVDRTFKLKMPSIFPRDMVQLTSTFVQAVAGADAAVQGGYIGKDTAQEIIVNALNQLGIEKSLDEVQAEVEEDEVENEIFGMLRSKPENQVDLFNQEKQRDLTGMAGETMPQNRRNVQMSNKNKYHGKAKGYDRKKRRRLAQSLME